MMQAKAIMCTTGFTLPLAKYLALSEKVSFPFVRVCVPELSATHIEQKQTIGKTKRAPVALQRRVQLGRKRRQSEVLLGPRGHRAELGVQKGRVLACLRH
jgi:hypothetical protein